MAIMRKVRTSLDLLRNEGPLGLIRGVKRQFTRSHAPLHVDEAILAYEVLAAKIPHGVMVDVGAHFGTAFRPFVEAGWRVIAFEPDSANRGIMEKQYGRCENLDIDPRAISDHVSRSATLFRSEISTGISSLSAFHESHEAGERVEVTTLGKCWTDYELGHIDFLKIDTEGYDLFVLRGYPWEFESPVMILCEFEDSKTVSLGYTYHDLAGFLGERGYRVIVSEWHPVRRYGEPHDWRRFAEYPCQLADSRGWGNLLAVQDEELYRSLQRKCGLDVKEPG